MRVTRLTVHPLLRFDLYYRLLHEIFLGLYGFQDYGVYCGFRAGAVWDGHHLEINNHTTGFRRGASRDAIVERRE